MKERCVKPYPLYLVPVLRIEKRERVVIMKYSMFSFNENICFEVPRTWFKKGQQYVCYRYVDPRIAQKLCWVNYFQIFTKLLFQGRIEPQNEKSNPRFGQDSQFFP